MRAVLQQFLGRKLVPEVARAQFDAAVGSVVRLRNSVPAEILIIAFVYGVGVFVVWRNYVALDANTWYATTSAAGPRLSLAGTWYGYVSLPLFQFLLLRWYFRVFIWARFLWQVSRIELRLVPTHPDRVGGLGFLANTAYAFLPLALSHGAVLAGMLANRILHLGAKSPEFKAEIVLMLFFVQFLVSARSWPSRPSCRVPSGRASASTGRWRPVTCASSMASGCAAVRRPESRWVGTADLQSLADLGNSFEIVKGMRLAPMTRDAILQLAAATLLPVVPLLLTMMPWDQLLKRLFGMVF